VNNYGSDGQGSSPGKGREFSLRHHVLTGSEAEAPSCSVDRSGSFSGGKAVEE
jgi:hypothetical protein